MTPPRLHLVPTNLDVYPPVELEPPLYDEDEARAAAAICSSIGHDWTLPERCIRCGAWFEPPDDDE
jgi:hypothetical protein